MELLKKRILIIAAHPDDEVLGCGGLISRFHQYSKFKVVYIAEGVSVRFTDRKSPQLKNEIEFRNKGSEFLNKFGLTDLKFHNLPCGTLPITDAKILHDLIQFEVEDFHPDYIFTHSQFDNHQDHRSVYEAVMVAVRPILDLRKIGIVSFEVPSSSEWNFEMPFTPNLFLNMSLVDLENKMDMMAAYSGETRSYPFPRSKEGIKTLAQYRGTQSGFNFAEAYRAIRVPIY